MSDVGFDFNNIAENVKNKFSKFKNLTNNEGKFENSDVFLDSYNSFDNFCVMYEYTWGKYHETNGIECQDYIKSSVSKDGLQLVIAVSDGASAAKFAKQAAEIAVKFAIDTFSKKFVDLFNGNFDEMKSRFIELLQKRFLDYFKNNTLDITDITDLSSTLSVLYIDYSTGLYITLNIGDGFICEVDEKYNLKVVLEPLNEEGNANITHFCIEKDTLENTNLKTGNIFEENIRTFIISTDGANILLNKEEFQFNRTVIPQLCVANLTEDKNLYYLKINEMREHSLKNDDIAVGIVNVLAKKNCKSEKDVDISDVFEAEYLPKEISVVLSRLFSEKNRLTYDELVDTGFCMEGEVLKYMIPLLRNNKIIYEDNMFCLNVNGE